jgi:hypothetical protein
MGAAAAEVVAVRVSCAGRLTPPPTHTHAQKAPPCNRATSAQCQCIVPVGLLDGGCRMVTWGVQFILLACAETAPPAALLNSPLFLPSDPFFPLY